MGRKFLFSFLLLLTFLLIPRNSYAEVKKGSFADHIISAFDQLNPTLAPSPTFTPTNTPTPSPIPRKTSYKIAAYGDSMVDTMGEVMEYLEHAMKKRYPLTTFTFYNYGIGAQNVEDGLARFDKKFDNVSRHFDPISEVQPDILIVGSFAYNPFSPHDVARHKAGLKELIKKAKNVSDEVYILVEIAPLRTAFGKGPGGVNWSDQTSYEHSAWIIGLLKNAITVGREMKVPVINLYERTYSSITHEGVKKFVNPHDGIHPSVEGHKFTADVIALTIKL